MSLYSHLKELPPDPIFGVVDLFKKDPRRDKLNLSAGVYPKAGEFDPCVFQSVKLAEEELLKSENTKNYLAVLGDYYYIEATRKFVFNRGVSDQLIGMQTVGGTEALRLSIEFIYRHITKNFSISDKTWANHIQIMDDVGCSIDRYPYWCSKLDVQKMFDHIKKLPKNTCVILQASSHNPTGCDLSQDEWKELSKIFHDKKLIPLFDNAYQGLGVGVDEDVFSVRYFLEDEHELFVCHSFSKSMALYNERVGALYVFIREESERKAVLSLLGGQIRTNYSNPPAHGCLVAKSLLQSETFKNLWLDEIKEMRDHLRSVRIAFAEKLGGDLSYISGGNGFFALLDLTIEQVRHIRKENAIYLTDSARINLAALNGNNLDRVVNAIKESL